MKQKNKQIILVVILLALLSGALLFFNKQANEKTPIYSPPTQEEAAAGDAIKQSQPSADDLKKPSDDTPPATKKQLEVIIADASQYNSIVEIRAFVPNILQSGTCDFTITHGNQKIIKQAKAIPDASSTMCTINLKHSEFKENGQWQLIVAYASSNYSGVSKLTELNIQQP